MVKHYRLLPDNQPLNLDLENVRRVFLITPWSPRKSWLMCITTGYYVPIKYNLFWSRNLDERRSRCRYGPYSELAVLLSKFWIMFCYQYAMRYSNTIPSFKDLFWRNAMLQEALSRSFWGILSRHGVQSRAIWGRTLNCAPKGILPADTSIKRKSSLKRNCCKN